MDVSLDTTFKKYNLKMTHLSKTSYIFYINAWEFIRINIIYNDNYNFYNFSY